MSATFYRHSVNGRTYDSRNLSCDGYAIKVESLSHYKRIVREAYGNLLGVKFETVELGADYECGHCGQMFTYDAYRAHKGY